MSVTLGLDIGSNSVGSAWFDSRTGQFTTGVAVFPAGVDESDDKRGEPKNAKRRMTRRTRITLARRAQRKRELRLKLIAAGLLPADESTFRELLDRTDPWALRRRGLDQPLSPHEFGRVLLHLAQRRGALGLRDLEEGQDADPGDDGKVRKAIGEIRRKMSGAQARTFGEFIALVRDQRVTPIATEDRRPEKARKGPRLFRDAVRNKAGSYEHCADRAMIREEFGKLWDAQKQFEGPLRERLTDELRLALDDESGDAVWRHKGLLFGQRRQSWDLGTLGRCALEPTERCVPHADMDASRFLVVETVNNLKIIEWGKEPRPLTVAERQKIKDYLSGPLGMEKPRRKKGGAEQPAEQPKTTVSVTDLRLLMGTSEEGWGRASRASRFRFNIESDEDRQINTDWFSREIIHGAVTLEKWAALSERVREGLNRAILKFDPDQEGDAVRLKAGVMDWAGLSEPQADALVAAWRKRPKPDAKRLNMSRRAARNLLALMDRPEPWDDPNRPSSQRWLTAIEARKLIAEDAEFLDLTTGQPLAEQARRRYATGAKGATARDRYYMRQHLLLKDGQPIFGPDGLPLAEPPPAPLVSNPVVRKAIHEVRRHLVEYMTRFGRKPDEVYVELAREAKMGKVDADRVLFQNRLRNRIRNEIIAEFNLGGLTSAQQRAAVDRVVLCVQQGGESCVCPLCGNQAEKIVITPRMAAFGEGCQVAHIMPKANGGHNGLANLVLAHATCNQKMGRRTPRQFWEATLPGGFEQGKAWIERIYGDINRIKPSETKSATGLELWKCYLTEQARPKRGSTSPLLPNYFTRRLDKAKIEWFQKDIADPDIQGMTPRQDAATKYAARQVMAYLADALFEGKGLPERSTGNAGEDDKQKIFATDGLWTSRLRREWGLRFDSHHFNAKGLNDEQGDERKKKDRRDHRHHAIDAIIIAMSTPQVKKKWEKRETNAGEELSNSADEEAMTNYRRLHPLPPPPPFQDREQFREAVRRAVFGEGQVERPICHRPVKRKLIGALHEETLFGPVLDGTGQPTGNYRAKKSVLALDPNHLRMPRPETEKEAIERLAARRQRDKGVDEKTARKWARQVVSTSGYVPMMVDPPPGKSGIVRDLGLRRAIRQCLTAEGLDPDAFTAAEIKRLCPPNDGQSWRLRMPSGVPIKSVVLLRTMSDPVIVDRRQPDYATGRMVRDDHPASRRAYVGGNNHHIEIRANDKGKWSGEVVSAFEAAQRKLAKLRAFRQAGIPKPDAFRQLPKAERRRLRPTLAAIEQAHPLVDRTDNDAKGGAFIMSLSEGETLFMRHKHTDEAGYFVVAKLDKPQSIVLVPHWDARAATDRKDAEGKKVPNSRRDQFSATPTDLKELAPPGHPHAVKVRVSPLGDLVVFKGD